MPEESEETPPPIHPAPGIIWSSYQKRHIERRHHVTEREFGEAWRSRDPTEDEPGAIHPTHGPSTASFGFTAEDRVLKLLWRFQHQDPAQGVFPLTAYTPTRRHSYTAKEVDVTDEPDEREVERKSDDGASASVGDEQT